jgi:hypothetical protein
VGAGGSNPQNNPQGPSKSLNLAVAGSSESQDNPPVQQNQGQKLPYNVVAAGGSNPQNNQPGPSKSLNLAVAGSNESQDNPPDPPTSSTGKPPAVITLGAVYWITPEQLVSRVFSFEQL